MHKNVEFRTRWLSLQRLDKEKPFRNRGRSQPKKEKYGKVVWVSPNTRLDLRFKYGSFLRLFGDENQRTYLQNESVSSPKQGDRYPFPNEATFFLIPLARRERGTVSSELYTWHEKRLTS